MSVRSIAIPLCSFLFASTQALAAESVAGLPSMQKSSYEEICRMCSASNQLKGQDSTLKKDLLSKKWQPISLAALPKPIKTQYLNGQAKVIQEAIASGKEPWQSGCIVNGKPKRKLAFCAQSGSTYLVAYEMASGGLVALVDVFQDRSSDRVSIKHLQLFSRAQSPADLNRALRANLFMVL